AVASANGAYTCGSGTPVVSCQTATVCPTSVSSATSSFYDACMYAKVNGFQVTNGGTQNVLVAANTTSPPPTVTGVTTKYWVTVTVAEVVPQTFSAVLGKPTTTVSARATAAAFPGSGGGCIYVLGSSGSDITMSGTA